MASLKPKSSVKILIADPHETSRHVICIMLHKLGYTNVFETGVKEEAETIIARHTKSNQGMSTLLAADAPAALCDLDLIIMDADMPPDSGMMYLAQLRQRFDTGSMPVLFTCMKGKESELSGASAVGANDTIVKPFSQAALKTKIEPMLTTGKAPVVASFDFPGAARKLSDKTTARMTQPAPEAVEKKPEPMSPVSKIKAATPAARPTAKKGTGGVAFQRRPGKVRYSTEGEPTATLVNGKIDGHYHEQVDVIGGGQNCYWARRIESEEKVRLDYLNAKGKSTGMEAKVIPLEQFMYTFYLCKAPECPILGRLAAEAEG